MRFPIGAVFGRYHIGRKMSRKIFNFFLKKLGAFHNGPGVLMKNNRTIAQNATACQYLFSIYFSVIFFMPKKKRGVAPLLELVLEVIRLFFCQELFFKKVHFLAVPSGSALAG